jgi:hypothetical protein
MSNLRSDRGPQFASHTWQLVCEKLGISPRKIVAYRPQGNPTERANRTIKECIKSYAEEHRDWDKNLCAISFALRTAINETTKHSTAMLTFGHELRSPFLTPADDPEEGYEPGAQRASEYANKLRQRMAETIAEVQENCRQARTHQAKYYNKGRVPAELDVGDWVMRKTNVLSDAARGVASSLAPLFEGPFRLSRKISDNVFELEDENGTFMGTRNVDQLRRFHLPPVWAERREGVTESDSESSDEDNEPMHPPQNPPEAIPHNGHGQTDVARPRRTINPPSRFQDFVMAILELP